MFFLTYWKQITGALLIALVIIQTNRLSNAQERATSAETKLAQSEAYTENLISTIDQNQAKQKELTTLSDKLKKEVHSAPDTDVECYLITRTLSGLREHQASQNP